MERQKKIDEVSGDLYTGTAVLGTPDNSPNWRIFKTDATGNDTDYLYPTDETGVGSSKEKFKWSDRLLLNFSATRDVTAPTLASAARNSNTQLTVTLSELANADSITKANAGGFTVEDAVTPATTYAVTAIAPGATDNLVVLTVATVAASQVTGLKVKYTAGGNGTVTDVATNALATNAVGVTISGW